MLFSKICTSFAQSSALMAKIIAYHVRLCQEVLYNYSMPYAPANPCRVPMCPNRQPCPEHLPRDLRRGRGYGRRWRDWRDGWYRRHGRKCAVCLAEGVVEPATELDHIVPVIGWPRSHVLQG